jgi:ATP-dependent Clp protease adaptor protein ClpS
MSSLVFGLKATQNTPEAVATMNFMATEQPPIQPPKPQLPREEDGGSVVLERRPRRSPPPMYQVVMLNDDFTPMEFVIVVLQEFFGKDREAATQIMLKIHLDGRASAGVPRDVAATKVEQVLQAAHKAGHPLQAVSEPVE